MKFEINGTFRISMDRYQPFNITVEAKNERLAREKTIVRLGSNHGCKRRFIKIEGVKSVK